MEVFTRLLLLGWRFGRSVAKKVYVWKFRKTVRHAGRNLQIQFPLVVVGGGGVEIGDDVSIAAFVHIWGACGVRIGNRVMIASHVAITSQTHDDAAPVMKESHKSAPVVIEDDVWIGAHSVIFPGIRVGEGAVIGAGSIVNKDIPAFAVAAGVPARVMRYRNQKVIGIRT